MNPVYEGTTVNGKMLGLGDPVRVKQGQHVLMHILNSSATEVHRVALAGHRFQVIALDGNTVPAPQTVDMLRLSPAERVSAVAEMNAQGVWIRPIIDKSIGRWYCAVNPALERMGVFIGAGAPMAAACSRAANEHLGLSRSSCICGLGLTVAPNTTQFIAYVVSGVGFLAREPL